jgi:hypothetical protein
MKLLPFAFFLVSINLFSQGQGANEMILSGLKKYPFESGRLVYEISGGATGTEEFVFDAYGWRSFRAQKMDITLYDISETRSLYEVTDGENIFRLDVSDSTYMLRVDTKWTDELERFEDPERASASILFELGGNKVGDTTLLDKSCDIWQFNGEVLKELWLWKGLVFKRKVVIGDVEVLMTAKSYTLNEPVNTNNFLVPDFYKPKQ